MFFWADGLFARPESANLSGWNSLERRIVGDFLEKRLGIAGCAAPENRRLCRIALAIAVSAMALRLFFWIYTGRLWEDALITTLHSENFWRGIGMTHYRPGQPPLHGFTSPLSVLIPLVGDAVRIGWGVQFLKLVSIPAGALAVLYMLGIAIHPSVRLPGPLAVLLMGYVAWEHHQILWGMAGMETQVVTTILVATVYYLVAWRPAAIGVCLGLCMLARPDFAFWTVIAGAYVLAKDRRAFAKVVAVALAVYLPWILFTTLYYGSPIPNTIFAKSMGYHLWWRDAGVGWPEFKREVWDRITGTYFFNTIFQPLGPSFGGHGTHFRAVIPDRGLVCDAMVFMLCLGSLAALVRRQWALVPLMGFVLVYGLYYVFFVPYVFGWYVVPFVALAVILSARGWAAVLGWIRPPRVRTAVLCALTAAYLALFVLILPKTFHAERLIQEHVENEGRKQMALYIREHSEPDQSIGCEPLGYISYFSGRPVYDWPGLANREVVGFQREHPDKRSIYDMFAHFEPDFLVMRPYEHGYLPEAKRDWFERTYVLDRRFEVPEDTRRNIFLIETNQDTVFLVFRKREAASGAVTQTMVSDDHQ